MRQLNLLVFCFFSILSFAADATLSEAQVFEWWDNGIIDADEAREILDLLEEGNTQEACILAEVYALESCTVIDTGKKTVPKTANKKKAKNKRPSLTPHGYIEWKCRTDSLGNLESQRTELRVNFYRYSLRLGSQSLLTYRNSGSEAHFGEISTKELHSVIPIDTLWGTALLYPLGFFRVGALLDTAKTTRFHFDMIASKEIELQLAYWHHEHTADSLERHSFSTQMNGNWGSFAAWWVPENKGDIPLMKLQLRHCEKMEYATLAWKADAYVHGDSLPSEAHLSSTIAKSRFWGSQTLGISIHDAWESKLALNARTIVPLEGDTSKTRFRASAESGPTFLRGLANITCLSAEEHCRQNDLAFKIQSAWDLENEQLVFAGKIRARHTRGMGFNPPLYEAGAAYNLDAFNSASVAITVPKGNPTQEIRIRNAVEIGIDFFQFSLAVTFRRTTEMPLHPLHAAIKAKALF